MTAKKPLQIHLSTAVLLMLACGPLIYLNARTRAWFTDDTETYTTNNDNFIRIGNGWPFIFQERLASRIDAEFLKTVELKAPNTKNIYLFDPTPKTRYS